MSSERIMVTNGRYGRKWWMSIIAILIDVLLPLLGALGIVPPETVVPGVASVTAIAAAHNLGQAHVDATAYKALGASNVANSQGPTGVVR